MLWILAFLAVAWGLGSSYRLARKPFWLRAVPLPAELRVQVSSGPVLYLIVVFSRQGCITCLQQIQFLRRLGENFVLLGAVPDNELADLDYFQSLGIDFPIIGISSLRGWAPRINPSVLGVNEQGAPLFAIPLLGRMDTVIELLQDNYNMLWPLLVNE